MVMVKKILFIQSFTLHKEAMSDEILMWEVYLENYIKSRIPDIKCDLLYLPVEQERNRLTITSYSQKDLFFKQMTSLISALKFEVEENTIICISVTTSIHYLSSIVIAEFFQKNSPSSIVVCGGAHPSSKPEDYSFKDSPFDYVVIGEGEIALYDLIINGSKKRESPKYIQSNPIKNLNELPELDLSIFNHYIKDFKHLNIHLSRGCPSNCSFCIERKNMIGYPMKTWRVYSPKRAIQEVSHMFDFGSENGIEDYGFYDPTFGLNRSWLNKFLDLYNFEEIGNPWIETRVDVMDRRLVERLNKKKFNSWYGVESFSKEMLYIMNKTDNPTTYLKRFEELYKVHLKIGNLFLINILCNHPGETNKTYDMTFQRLERMIKNDNLNPRILNIQVYHHFTGSKLYNDIQFFNKQYGTKAYLPEWYKNEDELIYGAYCIRPSSDLTLRESFGKYTALFENLFELNIRNIKREKNKEALAEIFFRKHQINYLRDRQTELFEFLDNKEIELF